MNALPVNELECVGFGAGEGVLVTGLSMEEMLLRGCTLQNTARVYGLAVYTGPETRIQRNAAPPPRKLG